MASLGPGASIPANIGFATSLFTFLSVGPTVSAPTTQSYHMSTPF